MQAAPIWGPPRGLRMLSDAACKKAVAGEKERKLADAGGLYLLVKPSGAKSWKFKFRFGGKEKKLTIGPYPLVTVTEARKARDQAKLQLLQGVDPTIEKRRTKAVRAMAHLDSFERVARAWHAVKAPKLAPRYGRQVLDRLDADVFAAIGAVPIKEITPPMVLEVVRAIEKRGSTEMAHRVRMHISDVFVWAIASGLCEQDPAAVIRKALVPTDGRRRPAATKLTAAQAVLKATEALQDRYWATRLASRLLALTAARPGVVRLAEREEFEDLDGEAPIWRVPAEKMKLTRERKKDAAFEFVMPLSRQAVDVVKAAIKASPNSWLFPGVGDRRKAISDSTLSGHYLDAKLRGKHVPHGWRASFSTIMNERAAVEDRERDRAIIDLMLAHVPEGVEAAYNRAAYMPRRRELAQAWADLLMEGMPPAEELVPAALR
jgi:hypothetical protein